MHPRHNLPIGTLLLLIGVLAVAGGLATVLATSPLSFDLARLALLQAIITPENTPSPFPTPSLTPLPASPTVLPTPTTSRPSILYLPTATDTATGQPTRTPGPTATATATVIILPADVRALAIVTIRVGAQAVRVHDLPNGAQIVAAIPGGTLLQVLFGSAIVDGVEWLPVRLTSGRLGWIAGYLLTITLQRPSGTGTVVALSTEIAPPPPLPPTEAPAATGQAPPPTAVPTATELAPAATDTASPTQPFSHPPTETPSPSPALSTHTPTPPLPSDTPITPPVSNTPTLPPTLTQPPADTATSTNAAPSDTPTPMPTDTQAPTATTPAPPP